MLLFSPATFEDGAFSTISKAKILNDDPLPSTPLAAGHPFHTISGLRSAHKKAASWECGPERLSIWALLAIPGPKEQAAWDFSVYSVLQTKKAIEKEGGRVNKMRASWHNSDPCQLDLVRLHALQPRRWFLGISSSCTYTDLKCVQGWFPKVVKKKTLLAPKKYPARVQEVWCRYMIDISWYNVYICMYINHIGFYTAACIYL